MGSVRARRSALHTETTSDLQTRGPLPGRAAPGGGATSGQGQRPELQHRGPNHGSTGSRVRKWPDTPPGSRGRSETLCGALGPARRGATAAESRSPPSRRPGPAVPGGPAPRPVPFGQRGRGGPDAIRPTKRSPSPLPSRSPLLSLSPPRPARAARTPGSPEPRRTVRAAPHPNKAQVTPEPAPRFRWAGPALCPPSASRPLPSPRQSPRHADMPSPRELRRAIAGPGAAPRGRAAGEAASPEAKSWPPAGRLSPSRGRPGTRRAARRAGTGANLGPRRRRLGGPGRAWEFPAGVSHSGGPGMRQETPASASGSLGGGSPGSAPSSWRSSLPPSAAPCARPGRERAPLPLAKVLPGRMRVWGPPRDPSLNGVREEARAMSCGGDSGGPRESAHLRAAATGGRRRVLGSTSPRRQRPTRVPAAITQLQPPPSEP